jgi:hypothetical protein
MRHSDGKLTDKIDTDKNAKKNGGSGGARTRHKFNDCKGKTAAPSPIASPVVAELLKVVSAWSKLPEPLKAAILAIVNSSEAVR